MADVLVSENITGQAMQRLQREQSVDFAPELWRDPAALARRICDVQALVVRNQTQVTAELLRAAPHLRIIGRAGAGLDNIDVEAASRAGIVVCFAPHENSVSVAELTLGLILALARKIPAADRDTRQGGWDRRLYTGTELAGKTLGIVGLGRIGSLVARRARAFDLRLLAHDQLLDPSAPLLGELGIRLLPLPEIAAQSDILTCHVPLSRSTHQMFNYSLFCQMKPTAFFINTSRGEVVDEEGLARALEERRLAGAALDVRAVEPAPPGKLSSMDNVILTPHVAAFTDEAQERVVEVVCRDVAAVLRGETSVNYCNFPSPQRDRG